MDAMPNKQKFVGFEGWQTADLDALKKPLMCGPGVPVGCKRAGKRQTWMPIRSHGCVALGTSH